MKLKRMTILYSLFILLLVSSNSNAQTTNEDIVELTNIANLRAEDYINARDKFIQSMSAPIDINDALDKGWEEGLLALIFNTRIQEPDLFKSWDNTRFTMDIAGKLSWSLRLSSNGKKIMQLQNRSIFITEIIWKFKTSDGSDDAIFGLEAIKANQQKGIWPKQFVDEMIAHTKNGMFLPKNIELWWKVALQSDNYNMKVIACSAIAMDESKSAEEFITSRLSSDSVDNEIKASIISGLYRHEPNYAASVLMKTYNDWKHHIPPHDAYPGFLLFTNQPIESDSNKFLKEIILSENELEGMREMAINSLVTHKRSPNDYITTLREILENSKSVTIRRLAATQLLLSPQSTGIPVIKEMLQSETDPYIIMI